MPVLATSWMIGFGLIGPMRAGALQPAGWQVKSIKLHLLLCCPQVVESTGVVVMPYLEYPQLLGMLLRLLSEGDQNCRAQVLKVRCLDGNECFPAKCTCWGTEWASQASYVQEGEGSQRDPTS